MNDEEKKEFVKRSFKTNKETIEAFMELYKEDNFLHVFLSTVIARLINGVIDNLPDKKLSYETLTLAIIKNLKEQTKIAQQILADMSKLED